MQSHRKHAVKEYSSRRKVSTGKERMFIIFKLEIKQDINEIISNKITYRNFKLKRHQKYL